MTIQKIISLQQFVAEVQADAEQSRYDVYIRSAKLIFAYNEFLNLPVTEAMLHDTDQDRALLRGFRKAELKDAGSLPLAYEILKGKLHLYLNYADLFIAPDTIADLADTGILYDPKHTEYGWAVDFDVPALLHKEVVCEDGHTPQYKAPAPWPTKKEKTIKILLFVAWYLGWALILFALLKFKIL